jgi:hypothetical protein
VYIPKIRNEVYFLTFSRSKKDEFLKAEEKILKSPFFGLKKIWVNARTEIVILGRFGHFWQVLRKPLKHP